MIMGSCLCGSLAFELDPAGIVLTTQCYCENCRKISGSQHGVYLQVKPQSFRWLAGDDTVATFESSPGNRRGFCRIYGCVAPVQTSYGAIRVPAGALDADPGIRPRRRALRRQPRQLVRQRCACTQLPGRRPAGVLAQGLDAALHTLIV